MYRCLTTLALLTVAGPLAAQVAPASENRWSTGTGLATLPPLPPPTAFPPRYSSTVPSRDFPEINAALKRLTAKDAPAPIPTPTIAPVVTAEVPAWRWYGYGAPIPGRNPYAPEGTYAPVAGQWYDRSGATPGAVPQPFARTDRPTAETEVPHYARLAEPVANPPAIVETPSTSPLAELTLPAPPVEGPALTTGPAATLGIPPTIPASFVAPVP